MNLAGFLKPLSALLAGAWLSRGLNFLTVILLVRRLGLSDIGLFYTGSPGIAIKHRNSKSKSNVRDIIVKSNF